MHSFFPPHFFSFFYNIKTKHSIFFSHGLFTLRGRKNVSTEVGLTISQKCEEEVRLFELFQVCKCFFPIRKKKVIIKFGLIKIFHLKVFFGNFFSMKVGCIHLSNLISTSLTMKVTHCFLVKVTIQSAIIQWLLRSC